MSNIELINKDVLLEGYSFMYPKGVPARIVKRVHDQKTGKTVLQGFFYNPVTKTCHDIQFDAATGVHEHYKATDVNSCYNVKINIAEL